MPPRRPRRACRIGVFLTARRCAGELVNAEPHKCSELAWRELDDLPGDTVSHIRAGLLAYGKGTIFSLDSWE
jgi:8-oxo-dGTP diphosphatase